MRLLKLFVLGEFFGLGVAPCVGAFIERRSLHTVFVTTKSHPVWVRLLKATRLTFLLLISHIIQVRLLKVDGPVILQQRAVAPCVGAFIDNQIGKNQIVPERERVLKEPP